MSSDEENVVYKKYIVDNNSDSSDEEEMPVKKKCKFQKKIGKSSKIKKNSNEKSESESEDEDGSDESDDKEYSNDEERDDIEYSDDDGRDDQNNSKLSEPESEDEDDDTEESESEEEDKKNDEVLFPQLNKLNFIKNKKERHETYNKIKQAKRKAKRELKKQKKKDEEMGKKKKKVVIHTIESKREIDATMMMDNDDIDLITEEAADQYTDYYSKSYEPKILITASDNIHRRTLEFMRELGKIIPNSQVSWRNKGTVQHKIELATKHEFTDMLVVNEDKRMPNGLLVIHLKNGPTALFRLSNIKTCKVIKKKFSDLTGHRPELILNNFKTRLGRSIARMFGALFHYEPEFKGRSVCTFHNQRDYIFFRHHRYQFRNEKRVSLKELGPRFTMRLEWLKSGVLGGDFEFSFKRREMTSRTKFNL